MSVSEIIALVLLGYVFLAFALGLAFAVWVWLAYRRSLGGKNGGN